MTGHYGFHGAATTLASAIMLTAACERSAPVKELAAGPERPLQEWDQVFTERKIDLRVPRSGPPLLAIRNMIVGGSGQLFVPDGGGGKRLLSFDSAGSLIREFEAGKDLKVSIIGALAIDAKDNLFAYDPANGTVTVLASPDYAMARRFRLRTSVSELLVLEDGSLVVYYPSDKKGAFKKFDAAGAPLGAVHPIRGDKLRIFHGRTQNGGIARDADGGLFGMVPSTFEIVRLSSDMKEQEILRGAAGDTWAPNAPEFPMQLNPYGYRPAHIKWWDSFRHVGRPYVLSPGVLLVTLFNSHGLHGSQDFANIYRTDGRIVAEGLPVPHDGRVVAAGEGKVYVAQDAHVGAGDAVIPLSLYEYRLRDSLASRISPPGGAVQAALTAEKGQTTAARSTP
jgi:hypothetical protein